MPPAPELYYTVSMFAHRHKLNLIHISPLKPQNHKIWAPTEALPHHHQCTEGHHSEHVRDEGLDNGQAVTRSLGHSARALWWRTWSCYYNYHLGLWLDRATRVELMLMGGILRLCRRARGFQVLPSRRFAFAKECRIWNPTQRSTRTETSFFKDL